MIRSTLLSAGWDVLGWGVFLVISLAACSDKNVEANADSADAAPQTSSTDMAPSSDDIEGMWELVAFQSGDATALNDDLADVEVTASFASDGSVSGRSGCNRYSTSIDFTDSGMRVGPVAGTKMACPGVRMEIEGAYTQTLTSARDYELEGNTLTLLDEDGTPLLRFERASDRDSEGSGTSETGGSARFDASDSPHSETVIGESRQEVQFRAIGNEPNWVLDVLEHMLHYRGPGVRFGRNEVVVPRADVDVDEGTPVLEGVGKGQTLEMRVKERACTNSMSGETFAYTVRVKVNSSTYDREGCGREVGTGLDADWATSLQSQMH